MKFCIYSLGSDHKISQNKPSISGSPKRFILFKSDKSESYGDNPPWTKNILVFKMAAKGKDSKREIHISYTS